MMIKADFLNLFLNSVKEVFLDFVKILPQKKSLTKAPNQFSSQMVVLMMGMLGEVEGEIILEIPPKSALKIVSQIYGGMEFSSLSDPQVESALFELMARICGKALKKMKNNDYKVELSPVSLFKEKEVEFCINKNIPVLKIDFETKNHDTHFSLYLSLTKTQN